MRKTMKKLLCSAALAAAVVCVGGGKPASRPR